MTYNADGSDFWLLAKSYARRFEDRYRKIRQEYDVGECIESKEKGGSGGGGGGKNAKSGRSSNLSSSYTTASPSTGSSNVPAAPPTLDARARFGSNLFLLSGVELGHVLTTCELDCPDALETCGSDRQKIEINVDTIPTDIFANLNTYVTQKVGNKGSSGNNEVATSPGNDTGGTSGKNRKRQRK